MKVAILFLLMAFSFNSYGQRIKEDRIDAFTKAHVQETSNESFFIALQERYTVSVRKIDGRYLLDFRMYGHGGGHSIPVNPGIMIMFTNDSIITIHPTEYNIPSTRVYNGSLSYSTEFTCALSLDDVRVISENGIKMFRYYTTDGYIEKNIKEKHSLKIQSLLNLVK